MNYVSSLILSRTSSKPNDVTAEKGTIDSKLVLANSSVNSIKFVFSSAIGLFEDISSKIERKVSEK